MLASGFDDASEEDFCSLVMLFVRSDRRLTRLFRMLNQNGAPKLNRAALIRMPIR